MWTGSTRKGVGGDREHSSAEGTPRHRADQAEPNRTAASELWTNDILPCTQCPIACPQRWRDQEPQDFQYSSLGPLGEVEARPQQRTGRVGCLPSLGRPRVTLCPEPLRHSTPSPNALVASSGCPACLTQTLRLPSQRPFLVA